MNPQHAKEPFMSYRISQIAIFAGGAVVATAAFLLGVLFGLEPLLADPKPIHDFFFNRTAIQWMTLAVAFFSLIIVVCRAREGRRLAVSLRRLRESPSDRSGLAPAAAARIERLREARKKGGPAAVAACGKELAERDADELERSYALVSGSIQLMLALGFFGTIYGVSRQLAGTFPNLADITTEELKRCLSQFTAALGTALDTTVLAVICGLSASVLVALVHWVESAALRGLDDYLSEKLGFAGAVPDVAAQASWILEDRLPKVAEALVDKTAESFANLVSGAVAALKSALEDLARKHMEALEAHDARLAGVLVEKVCGEAAAAVTRAAEADGERTRALMTAELSDVKEKLGERPQVLIRYPGQRGRRIAEPVGNGTGG
ncbi:MAG: hypothetical protein HY721_09550 [Planctomycetes bacterium]|nr:hypothetical protein [Planctomycetota bacterium]